MREVYDRVFLLRFESWQHFEKRGGPTNFIQCKASTLSINWRRRFRGQKESARLDMLQLNYITILHKLIGFSRLHFLHQLCILDIFFLHASLKE